MDIELLVVDADNGNMHDVSELAQQVEWMTSLGGSASQLSFKLTKSDFNFPCGSDVIFRIPNKQNVFRGKVFTTSYDKERELDVLCYDQMRILKNSDTYIFKNKKAHEIFEKICKDWNLKYEIRAQVDHICVPFPYDNKPLGEIIQTALDETFVFAKEYLFMRDEFGVLVLDNLFNYRRNYVLDKDFLQENFSYSRSIDSDVYNQIKLMRTDDKNQVEALYFVENPANVQKWGRLQYFEKAEQNASAAELKTRAEGLLAVKNKPKQKLSFTTEGKLDLFAGCGFRVNLSEIIPNETIKFCIIQTARHTFTNNEHKMQLEVIL